MTTTRHLIAVPAQRSDDDVDQRGLPRHPTAADVLTTWASSADALAATTEAVQGQVAGARRELLAGKTGVAGAQLAQLDHQLRALAATLAEMHGGLEELAHLIDPTTGPV